MEVTTESATDVSIADSTEWMGPAEQLRLPALSLAVHARPGLQGVQATSGRQQRIRGPKTRRDQSTHQNGLKSRYYTGIETHRLRCLPPAYTAPTPSRSPSLLNASVCIYHDRYRISSDPAARVPSDYDPPRERERREQADQAVYRLAGDMRFSGARGCLDGKPVERVPEPYTEMYRVRLQEEKRRLRHCLAHESFRFSGQGPLSGKPPVYTPLPPDLQNDLRRAADFGRPGPRPPIPRGAQTVR